MGIKELWPILQPFAERKPLYELEGKIVAIDLAGWVCESLCVVDYMVQPRFYLRNLFFRTCYLLLSGVTPVFVLEGDAPPLKYGVICKRNELQFKGAKPRALTQTESQKTSQPVKKPDKGRSRFNYVLKQCEELIASMGLQCVQGPGEAEQFCSFLNEDKLVDGVISQDSDCFAYGARRVYRNFSVSTQGSQASQGGAVDVYDIDTVQKSMDFGRNKMIVLALLCGCDYCPGVNGVGKDAAMKLLNRYSENEILARVKSWRSIDHKYTSLEVKVADKSYCVNCGHLGRAQNHSKNGCSDCRMHRGCDTTLWKEQRLAIKSELQIRKKAMADQDFPSQKVIDEFLNRPVTLPKLDLNWKQPSVAKFLKFMSHLLQWDEIYCFQKFLPLLTRWQLFHYGSDSKSVPLKGNVCPDYIKKKRTPKGIASYEIIWKDEQKCFEGLIPEEQVNVFLEQNSTLETLWSTVEPVDLVQKAYPDLVSSYLDTIIAKTKKPSKASKSKSRAPIISDNDNKENDKPIKAKKKLKPKDDGKTKPIVEYFKKVKNVPSIVTPKTKPNTKQPKNNPRTQSPKIETCPTPMRLIELSFDFNDSSSAVHDLSDIIQGIVSTSPTITNICGKKLFYECAVKQPEQLKSVATIDDKNDETTDEYDMIVAGMKPLSIGNVTPTTSRKKPKKRPSHTISKSQNDNNGSPSTTPIIIKKFFKRNHIVHKTSALASSTPTVSPDNPTVLSTGVLASSTPTIPPESPSVRNDSFKSISSPTKNTEANVSYFFGDITAENDIFEKLTDFRNMDDDKSNDEDDAAVRQDDELQDVNDSLPIELSETFDLDEYVPVGANLKKRIAS